MDQHVNNMAMNCIFQWINDFLISGSDWKSQPVYQTSQHRTYLWRFMKNI